MSQGLGIIELRFGPLSKFGHEAGIVPLGGYQPERTGSGQPGLCRGALRSLLSLSRSLARRAKRSETSP